MKFELSTGGTLAASAAATLGANLLLGHFVGHDEVPKVQWTTTETNVSQSGYDLTSYRPTTDSRGKTVCVRDYTVERDITTSEQDHGFPYLVPVPVPIRRRNKTEPDTDVDRDATLKDEYSGFADPTRAREIIEYVADAPSRSNAASTGRDGTARGGGRFGGDSVGSRSYNRTSREGSSDRWAKVGLATASAMMLIGAPLAFEQLDSDSLICKERGNWAMRFCGLNGEEGDKPSTAPMESSKPHQTSVSPSAQPSVESTVEQTPTKGGTPGEGAFVPSTVVDSCEGVPTYTDVTLIVNKDGEHISTNYQRVQP